MSKVVETVERDGEVIRIYESGAEYSVTRGRLVKPAARTLITSQNATEYNRKRQEKTAAALRQAITAAMNAGLLPPGVVVRDSAEAAAAAGAAIWEAVVMNPEAYPRDRLEAWDKLSKYMGALPADIKHTQPDDGTAAARLNAAAAGATAEAAAVLARVLADVARIQQAQPPAVVIDGTASDLPPASRSREDQTG